MYFDRNVFVNLLLICIQIASESYWKAHDV